MNDSMQYDKARRVFEQYLDGYDRTDDKVKLKIVHTYGVVEQSTELARRMNLTEEDTFLARMIALLHDIGRFEQLRLFDSFMPDTMDHAAYGVNVLFEEGMIRRFLEDNKWDDVIRTAIALHSDYKLPEISDPRIRLHARLIRDADKLDNCRVKLEDRLETLLGAKAEEIGAQKISPRVRDEAMTGHSILSEDRATKMDYWVSYVAYFYDMNFRESLDIVREQDYVRRIIGRIPYSDPETADTMKRLEEKLLIYIGQTETGQS